MIIKEEYIISILFIALLACSCSNNTVFTDFKTLPVSGWSADSVLHFDVEVTDTVGLYDIIVDIRHTTSYPYQNMWLFVNSDTIDFYLANQRGEWLGNGRGELREMPVLYKHDYKFDSCGVYSFSVRQAMRADRLAGVRDVGLIIEKK